MQTPHALKPFESTTRRPLLVGVVHLRALPGAPRFEGDLEAVLSAAEADARTFVDGGADALVVENFGDLPFRAERVDPETVGALALALERVGRAVAVPIGVNVLRNDARAGLGLCAVTRAGFVRVNVHTGAAVTDQGLIQGRADETLRERARLGLECELWVDVHVKHAAPLAPAPIAEAARDAVTRGAADALIVSGAGTGRPVDGDELDRVRAACPGTPILIGSGLDPRIGRELGGRFDGAIVGTWAKRDGAVSNPVDPDRVRTLREALDG